MTVVEDMALNDRAASHLMHINKKIKQKGPEILYISDDFGERPNKKPVSINDENTAVQIQVV